MTRQTIRHVRPLGGAPADLVLHAGSIESVLPAGFVTDVSVLSVIVK